MSLIILNCSPKGKAGNTNRISQWFVSGCVKAGSDYKLYYLNNIAEHDNYIGAVKNSNIVIFVMPLYTYCMPGIVKAFMEKLEAVKDDLKHLKIGYIVHSGLTEARNSAYLVNYLKAFSEILGVQYLGTVVRGRSEGYKIMPSFMTVLVRSQFAKLGKKLVLEGSLDSSIIDKLAKPHSYSKFMSGFLKIICKTPLYNLYWDIMLKMNRVLKKSFDRPYL